MTITPEYLADLNKRTTIGHGTRTRYHYGCRCPECREAQKLHQRTLQGKEPRKHGTQSAYVNYGCRCELCKKAGSEYNRSESQRRARKRYAKQHPDKMFNLMHKRRTATKEGEDIDRSAVADRDGWRCHICGKKVTHQTWSLDHLVPISKGGEHTFLNVRLAHRSCNSARGAGKLPAQLILI